MINNIKQALLFAKRDFQNRYIDTNLGQLWFVISPIIMITIYSVIFSEFMKLKMTNADNNFAYSIYLIPGILAWTAFSSTISTLSTLIEQKSNFLKKINIPLYVFLLSTFFTEFFIFIISMSLSFVFLFIVDHPITTTFLYLIPIMTLQMFFAFGIGVIFALFRPFFKDLKVLIPIIMQLWFWMSPIIYMKEMIINKVPIILTINPFFYFLDIYHDIYLYSKAPSIENLFILFAMTSFVLLIAIYLYKKLVSTIKDII